MNGRDNKKQKSAGNGEGNRDCDLPGQLEKKHAQTKQKEGETEGENNWKVCKNVRDRTGGDCESAYTRDLESPFRRSDYAEIISTEGI
ncbi:hypothetical protein CVT25_003779 [Psilocybe cyanescens]|uniref:Uncharacterized protein n=1 Tax=Psilocybe cyanescens TaxID=93625 RepID=A0A409WX06_PSICY|nr:hypothetical protein CVT25_003779 [Psilocybe cyanescens]